MTDFVADPIPLPAPSDAASAEAEVAGPAALPGLADMLGDDGAIPGLQTEGLHSGTAAAAIDPPPPQVILVDLPLDLMTTSDLPLST